MYMNRIILMLVLCIWVAGCENKQLVECQEQNSSLETEMSALEDKLALSLDANQELSNNFNDQVSKLTEKTISLNDEISLVKGQAFQEKTDLQSSLKKAQGDLTREKQTADELRVNVNELSSQVSAAKAELDQTKQKNVELENKLNATQSKNKELTTQIEALQKQNAEMVARIKELEKIIAELKSKSTQIEEK